MRLIAVAFLCAFSFGNTYAETIPIATPDQRLALEITQLPMRNAYLTTDLEKARAEIEALKAKLAPDAPKP